MRAAEEWKQPFTVSCLEGHAPSRTNGERLVGQRVRIGAAGGGKNNIGAGAKLLFDVRSELLDMRADGDSARGDQQMDREGGGGSIRW
jgi:hypothetical protein